MLSQFLLKLTQCCSLTRKEASEALEIIFHAEGIDHEIVAFLVALSMKKESFEELLGFTTVMKKHMLRIPSDRNRTIFDNSGTGGDMKGTFNISTVSSFILAGAGLVVAKHGNSSISSRSGSTDMLKKLNVPLARDVDEAQRMLNRHSLSFLSAPVFHPNMKKVSHIRRALKMRTIFNLLGPLCNPAEPSFQMIGVFSKEFMIPMAKVLREMGSTHVILVHGDDGLDEVSLTGLTHLVILSSDGSITEQQFFPQSLGLNLCQLEDLKGEDPSWNAKIALKILKGEDRSPKRISVCLNAAFLLQEAYQMASIKEAFAIANDILDSGKALQKLQECSSG